jgi:hypothetical protein
VYIDTGSSMPISPSKSRDLADENNKMEMIRNNRIQPTGTCICYIPKICQTQQLVPRRFGLNRYHCITNSIWHFASLWTGRSPPKNCNCER